MLFRHFFAFPPASDMSAPPRLLTAAPSLPAASGLGRLAADTRHHHGSSSKAKAKSTHGGKQKQNNESITPPNTRVQMSGGRWVSIQQKEPELPGRSTCTPAGTTRLLGLNLGCSPAEEDSIEHQYNATAVWFRKTNIPRESLA